MLKGILQFFTEFGKKEWQLKKKKKSKKQQLLTLGENNFVQEKEYFVSNIYIEIIHVNTECSSFQILWENCTEKNKKKEKKEWRKGMDMGGWGCKMLNSQPP